MGRRRRETLVWRNKKEVVALYYDWTLALREIAGSLMDWWLLFLSDFVGGLALGPMLVGRLLLLRRGCDRMTKDLVPKGSIRLEFTIGEGGLHRIDKKGDENPIGRPLCSRS